MNKEKMLEEMIEDSVSFIGKCKEKMLKGIKSYFDLIHESVSPLIGAPCPRELRYSLFIKINVRERNGIFLIEEVALGTGERIGYKKHEICLAIGGSVEETNYCLKADITSAYNEKFKEGVCALAWFEERLDEALDESSFNFALPDSITSPLEQVGKNFSILMSAAKEYYKGENPVISGFDYHLSKVENYEKNVLSSIEKRMSEALSELKDAGICVGEPVIKIPLNSFFSENPGIPREQVIKGIGKMFKKESQELPNILEKLRERSPELYLETIKVLESETRRRLEEGLVFPKIEQKIGYWKSIGIYVEDLKNEVCGEITKSMKEMRDKKNKIMEI